MQSNAQSYLNLFALRAKESPLNALRLLNLSIGELKGLAIICHAIHETDFADLIDAEVDMREMLAGVHRRLKCLN